MDKDRIQLGMIYKRKPYSQPSPYPKYLIPTGVNVLMTTTLMMRYYYDDVEKGRDSGDFSCITESSLQEFYELIEGEQYD